MQLNIDFSRRPVLDSGKKTERITITCSSDFKEFLQKISNMQHTTIAELGYQYILEGMRNDLAKVFMAFPHLDKKLREIIK